MPTVSDYGGNNYGNAVLVTKCKENQNSFRCDDCGTLRFVNRREWYRAARPRCLKCGGVLVETDATVKDIRGTLRPPPPKSVPKRRCEGCGVVVVDNKAMASHLTVGHPCMATYGTEKKTLPIPPFGVARVVASSVYLEKSVVLPRSKPFGVFGVTSQGHYICLFNSSRKLDCVHYINEHFGAVSLAR